ncbi:DUF445 domain-containing protein [Fusibacter sp. 3D3]|uniref:DUF445 domain-containing protein n=1 Tax=Fusibacter sp. 3D3 TaxID=1048380 RepID=UPI000853B9E0|nr:DUF445 family protein [Fusibacter sp. 3D3]GAU77153.1 hypothetical protein F3D3_1767 [Fusibacter sp. 3D3]
MLLKLLILAMIGGVIGWMTNVIAIKLLFRPINPIKIPLTPFKIQGLIPKRKAEISKSIGEIVDQELISIEQILDHVIENTDKAQIVALVKEKVLTIAEEKMPSIIPSMFKKSILASIGEIIDQNGEQMIIEMTEKLSHKVIESVDVAKIVEDKLNAYDFEKLEEMTLKIAKTELKSIEVLGGIIGFFIGIFQGIVVLFILK